MATVTRQPARMAYDCAHVRRVTVWVLLFNGDSAGRIVANHGQSRVVATVSVWAGPLGDTAKSTGLADGYGYHKLSAAVADALGRVGLDAPSMSGAGDGAIELFFIERGYQVIKAI